MIAVCYGEHRKANVIMTKALYTTHSCQLNQINLLKIEGDHASGTTYWPGAYKSFNTTCIVSMATLNISKKEFFITAFYPFILKFSWKQPKGLGSDYTL